MRILVINGPNLGILGNRGNIYGNFTLSELEDEIREYSRKSGHSAEFFQSDIEGEIIAEINSFRDTADAIIINAGGYSHTSVSLRDSVSAFPGKKIEVHISNISARESFRHESFLSPVCDGVIFGFGKLSYILAVDALTHTEKSMVEKQAF